MPMMTSATRQTIDIADFIDQRPVGPFQARLILMCATILFADGFDTQAIGYVAPELARLWHMPRPALGPVFSAGLFGLMLGALALSPVADRIGGKRLLLGSTVWFAVCTLATALAHDTGTLIANRPSRPETSSRRIRSSSECQGPVLPTAERMRSSQGLERPARLRQRLMSVHRRE